ncbi:GIY-YIG nuclease family protein [Prosthecobacter fluviatilis]|uniref:GIY-YIG nuclease family protein n=1 Tax=Prosthecobacter fluviatilis TaxID=445931 RepID=A0ABW0KVN4_9BACT
MLATQCTSPPPTAQTIPLRESPFSVVGLCLLSGTPSVPGVYFFYDKEGDLPYIGKSLDLKKRIARYRYVTPEKKPSER